MVIKELIYLEDPPHWISTVEAGNLQLHSVLLCRYGVRTRDGGGDRWLGVKNRGYMLDKVINFMGEGQLLCGKSNEDLLELSRRKGWLIGHGRQ